MKRSVANACLLCIALACGQGRLFSQSAPTITKDPVLEKARDAFERKVAQIDQQASKDREKAEDKIRKEYSDSINKMKKRGDMVSADFYGKELTALVGEGGDRADLPAMEPGKPYFLLDMQPIQKQGTCEIKTEHEKEKPAINGRITTTPFLWAFAPSTSDWHIPVGARVFRAYAHKMFPGLHDGDCIMEVRIDGVPVFRSQPLSTANRTAEVVVAIPRGAKTLTLISDPHRGGIDGDYCVWVEPYFFSR
jgi:hypothetical protein